MDILVLCNQRKDTADFPPASSHRFGTFIEGYVKKIRDLGELEVFGNQLAHYRKEGEKYTDFSLVARLALQVMKFNTLA